jgi:hypothetical protein
MQDKGIAILSVKIAGKSTLKEKVSACYGNPAQK